MWNSVIKFKTDRLRASPLLVFKRKIFDDMSMYSSIPENC